MYDLLLLLYLHLAGIPRVLDRLDPADVGNAPVKERTGLANKHTQSQRRPVRLCRRGERERGKKERESRERDDVGRTRHTEVKGGEVSSGRKREGRK